MAVVVAAAAAVDAIAVGVCQMNSSIDQSLVPAGADSLLSKTEKMAAVAGELPLYLMLFCFERLQCRLDCQLVG